MDQAAVLNYVGGDPTHVWFPPDYSNMAAVAASVAQKINFG